MMKLKPNETIVTGNWIEQDGKVIGDENENRIQWLIDNHLQQVAFSPVSGAWETLFKDPDDGRYWERTYPHSGMHGGGPLQLIYLTPEQAEEKYEMRQHDR